MNTLIIERVEKLARITSARLELQDREILSFWITVNYEDGFSQGVGGIALDEWDAEKEERQGTAYGCEMIRRLLLELGVNDFSEMAGKHIWVIGEEAGFAFTVKGLRALKVDNKDSKPIIFGEVLKDFK